MTLTVLAFDQSPTATGWAIGSPNDQKPRHGVFEMDKWGNNEGDRLVQFHRWMMDKCQTNEVSDVFYEQPFLPGHGNFHSIEPQFFLIGHINFVARLLKLPVRQVAMASWRSRFLGTTKAPPGLKGDAGRQELKKMALRACSKRGWVVWDDNAAEALGIWDYACSTLDRNHSSNAGIFAGRQESKIWNGER
mgnify:CR=1 FL=1